MTWQQFKRRVAIGLELALGITVVAVVANAPSAPANGEISPGPNFSRHDLRGPRTNDANEFSMWLAPDGTVVTKTLPPLPGGVKPSQPVTISYPDIRFASADPIRAAKGERTRRVVVATKETPDGKECLEPAADLEVIDYTGGAAQFGAPETFPREPEVREKVRKRASEALHLAGITPELSLSYCPEPQG